MMRVLLLVALVSCEQAPGSLRGVRATYEAATAELRDQAVATLQRRLDALGLANGRITTEGMRILVELPGTSDPAVLERIARHARLEFRAVLDDDAALDELWRRARHWPDESIQIETDRWTHAETDPPIQHQVRFLAASDREALERFLRAHPGTLAADREILVEQLRGGSPAWRTHYVERRAELTGRDVERAAIVDNPNMPVTVEVAFDERGRKIFGELTARLVGRKLAIAIDGVVVAAPIVNTPIRGGKGLVTMGGADVAEQTRAAEKLVDALRGGGLAAALVLRDVTRL